ncbi:HAD-like protein [Microthyrium microscopicum]|uniref:HAD-like protein n=1 Tax=Microthyrium microscopicum TaxID=703497 RepID=A0A6A6UFZ9_9PEZI|nr:HAD-like protein [Microthyrium microscopicum]
MAPKVLLFDIGGVCVVSPFQAILDYEIANGIPPGYINATIQARSPHGAWQQLERGELILDDAFFNTFGAELNDMTHWRNYCRKAAAVPKSQTTMQGLLVEYGADSQGVLRKPIIDSKTMFWNMMRMSRQPDPWMFPALVKLKNSGRFVIAALSNTIAFPKGVMDETGAVFESGLKNAAGEAVGQIRDSFDTFVSSAHVGLRKPQREIYDLAIEESNKIAAQKGLGKVEAKDVLFLDDIGTNLKAAKAMGMGTIKVTLGKSKDAVRELEKAVGMSLIDESSRL